jgi:hypothetical protein
VDRIGCLALAVTSCLACGKPVCDGHRRGRHCLTCVGLARHYGRPAASLGRAERDAWLEGPGAHLAGDWERGWG